MDQIVISTELVGTLILVCIVLCSLSALMLYIQWRYITKAGMLEPLKEDIQRVIGKVGEVDVLKDKTDNIIDSLVKLGIIKSGTTSVMLALQHPTIIKFLKEAFQLIPMIASVFFGDYSGNAVTFARAFLTKFDEAEGAIDALVEDGISPDNYKEIKEQTMSLINDAGEMLKKIEAEKEMLENSKEVASEVVKAKIDPRTLRKDALH